MKRGIPPKPTPLKLLQGNPGRRPINENEPKPDLADAAQEPPFELGEEARRVWDTMVPVLSRIGLLTVCDLRLLARYCDMLTRYLAARDLIDKKGEYYTKFEYYNEQIMDEKGQPTGRWERKSRPLHVLQFPHVNVYFTAQRELTRLENELGLTPSARSRIEVEVFNKGNQPGDTFAAYVASNTRKPLVS